MKMKNDVLNYHPLLMAKGGTSPIHFFPDAGGGDGDP